MLHTHTDYLGEVPCDRSPLDATFVHIFNPGHPQMVDTVVPKDQDLENCVIILISILEVRKTRSVKKKQVEHSNPESFYARVQSSDG